MNTSSHIDLTTPTATQPVITQESISAESSLADTQQGIAPLAAESASDNINRPVYQILPQRHRSRFRVRYREGTSVSKDCTLCQNR